MPSKVALYSRVSGSGRVKFISRSRASRIREKPRVFPYIAICISIDHFEVLRNLNGKKRHLDASETCRDKNPITFQILKDTTTKINNN